MAAIIGLKEKFLAERKDLIDKAYELYRKTGSWEDVEKFLREEFKEELSIFKPNLFTYFLLVGGILLLPSLYLWKVYFEPGTTAHFLSRLTFMLAAMFSLKGIVGHYVILFINRDRFEVELNTLKASIKGGNNGKQSN
ncbi:hypothetical protein GFV12_02760 [Desulfurobacterium thermolithotrophum]|uniref:hypothetical protein n=1 Tax=Desulfurobacterium thermolithotrophum TaxID=64160 RepID=UPI0013D894DF|nr:hypothetical protein [Desulfurobacterium thermolithotrophum]